MEGGRRQSSIFHHRWIELISGSGMKEPNILHFQLTALTSQQYRAHNASDDVTPCLVLMVEHCLICVRYGSGIWKKLQMRY